MRSEFNISCGRGQGVLVASRDRLCRKFVLQNVGGSEWVRSQNQLRAWRWKDRPGLYESSYCHFKVYAGTRNLNWDSTKPGLWTGPWTGLGTQQWTAYV